MNFIRSFSYINIGKKFLLLYMLNILDILFTLILLETGLFEEANSFMATIVTDPFKAISIKVLLVGALLYIVYKRMERGTLKQLFISNYIINTAVIAYVFINISHFVWCIYYFIS